MDTWTWRDIVVRWLLVQIELIKKRTVFDPDLTETLIQGVGIVCIHGESIYSFIQKNIKNFCSKIYWKCTKIFVIMIQIGVQEKSTESN